MCRVIDAHDGVDVVFGIDNLGKEELLVALAHRYRTLVVVLPDRLRWIRLCDVSDESVFTDEPGAGRFIVEPRRTVTRDRIRTLNEERGPTIGIVASGWATAGRAGARAAAEVRSGVANGTAGAAAGASSAAAAAMAKARRKKYAQRRIGNGDIEPKDDDSIDELDDEDVVRFGQGGFCRLFAHGACS